MLTYAERAGTRNPELTSNARGDDGETNDKKSDPRARGNKKSAVERGGKKRGSLAQIRKHTQQVRAGRRADRCVVWPVRCGMEAADRPPPPAYVSIRQHTPDVC
jgi:hypothetical protein